MLYHRDFNFFSTRFQAIKKVYFFNFSYFFCFWIHLQRSKWSQRLSNSAGTRNSRSSRKAHSAISYFQLKTLLKNAVHPSSTAFTLAARSSILSSLKNLRSKSVYNTEFPPVQEAVLVTIYSSWLRFWCDYSVFGLRYFGAVQLIVNILSRAVSR